MQKIMMESVSVVVPFFNRSYFLSRLLSSIRNQKMKPKEVLIVDNGSSYEEIVKCWDILQEFKCLNILFFSSLKTGNANYARNAGFYLSSSRYVAYLDSDDWWDENHLYESVNLLILKGKSGVYSGAKIFKKK